MSEHKFCSKSTAIYLYFCCLYLDGNPDTNVVSANDNAK